MALMIRERMDGGFYSEVLDENNSVSEGLDVSEASVQLNIDPDSVMVDIEGIHAAPFVTRNFTRYMPNALKNSVPSWTKPYRKPVIKHHNEADGEIIGRVCSAKFKTDDTLSGTPALEFTVNVPGAAKEDVKNGLLETTSIGGIVNDVRCSICGQQLANGEECEHQRGHRYGKEICTWDMYDLEAKELSYVIVPSDQFSRNLRVYPATKSKPQTQVIESFDSNIKKGEDNMDNKDAAVVGKELDELKAQLKTATEAKEAAEATVAELTSAKEALEAKVTALEAEKTQLETTVAESKEMQGVLEIEIADAKQEIKESLISTVKFMRESLGKKALEDEVLQARSVESLKDSILDMKEDFNFGDAVSVKENVDSEVQTPEPNSVQNPTVQETGKDVKESVSEPEEKIDLKSELYAAVFNVTDLYK